MSQARLAVSLSGGAALGAYQAGAMAALLVAVERLRDEDPDTIVLDAVGGASAGALVGLLASTCHLTGLDPVDTLYGAWVEEVSLDLLLDHTGAAPLGSHDLERRLEHVLLDADPVREPSASAPIALHIALSGLRGLTYRVAGLRGEDSIPASTYADWVRTELRPGLDRHELTTPPDASPVHAALASAANPGVFPPRLLDRSADVEGYEARGITDLPEDARLWFTDGGLMQMEPIGRLLEAVRDVHADHGDDQRVVLLVDPRSEGPSTGRTFADPDRSPTWLGSLSRALSILPAQILYEDLRRVDRDNRRIAQRDELLEALDGVLGGLDEDRRAALVDFVRTHHEGGEVEVDDDRALLRAALGVPGGVEEKTPVLVDVLTPLLLLGESDDHDELESLLAGELLGDLGGFLDQSLRHSDFVLGYATTLRWLPDGLGALGLDDRLVELAVTAVRDAHDHDWRDANSGRTSVSDLPRRSQLQLVELAASAAVGVVAEALGAVDTVEALSRARHAVVDRLAHLLPGWR